jgi:hypothetical protein
VRVSILPVAVLVFAAGCSSAVSTTTQAGAPAPTVPQAVCGARVNAWLASYGQGGGGNVGQDISQSVQIAGDYLKNPGAVVNAGNLGTLDALAEILQGAPSPPGCADPQGDWQTWVGDLLQACADSGACGSAPDNSELSFDMQQIGSDFSTLSGEFMQYAGVTP